MSSKKYGPRFLKGLREFRVAKEVTTLAVEEFLSALDCPRSLTVWLMFKNKEHKQLADLTIDPKGYNSPDEFRDAYAATKFLSKFTGLTLDYDLDEVALTKFRDYETLCKHTNNRFRNLSTLPEYKGKVVWLHNAVIRKIDKILGDFSAEEFFSSPDWGPGASTLIKRRFASPAYKFQCETGITRDLYALLPVDLLKEVFPLWAGHLSEIGFPTYQTGNRVVTVPKDATTNRVIAIEPGLNLFFQSSIGDMIKRRLLRYGVDLRYQSRNQQLAYVGSVKNHLATVDLSSASDSIARSVVEELLPPRWFGLMDACRSHFGTLSGSQVKWEKFSSMGNGFTFQLESLIFYAIASCCAEYHHVGISDVSVYGDDIILPTSCFGTFQEMMDFYGFRINLKKSHFDSPFRESCGAHYFTGSDVKPVYLKDSLSTVQSIYRLANAIRRFSHRQCSYIVCDGRFRKVFELLVHKVPSALRLRIPETLGDGGFISNFDEATPSRARNGIEGYHVRNVVEIAKSYQEDRVGYLLSALWVMPDRLEQTTARGKDRPRLEALAFRNLPEPSLGRNSVPLKNLLKIKVANSLVQQWYDLGPWVN